MFVEAFSWAVIGYVFIYAFLLPWQSGMGHYIAWERSVEGSMAALYAQLGKLAAGSSRTKFSLLLLAHLPDGIPILAWGVLASLSVEVFPYGTWDHLLERIGWSPPPSNIGYIMPACFFLPTVAFILARNAARTVVCGLCTSTGEKEKGQKERQSCTSLRYRKDVFLPCSFWQFFWPETFLEVADREKNSFPVRIVSGGIGNHASCPECPKKPNVPLEQAARTCGGHEGKYSEHSGGTYPTEGNDDLFGRSGLEKTGSFRISDETRRNGQETKKKACFPESTEAVFFGADLNDTGRNSGQFASEVMADFVEKGMQAEAKVAERELGRGDKPEEQRGDSVDASRGLKLFQETEKQHIENTNTKRADGFKQNNPLLKIWYITLFPIYSFFLLPTAIRSRFDWWVDKSIRKDKSRIAIALTFVGWVASWLVEAYIMGVAAVIIGWQAVRFS
ncbi:MAG: hypothetical protein K6U74_07300 [Firmicutes bacterium]|nr:hypothetical protein [Bacillota bacterium]